MADQIKKTVAANARIYLRDVRLSYPVLFTPRNFQGQGEEKFSASFIFPPDHPASRLVDETIDQVGKIKWKDEWPSVKRILEKKELICVRDGDSKPNNPDGYKGMRYVNASNKTAPLVLDRNRVKQEEKNSVVYG